jgi:hypothetical protein
MTAARYGSQTCASRPIERLLSSRVRPQPVGRLELAAQPFLTPTLIAVRAVALVDGRPLVRVSGIDVVTHRLPLRCFGSILIHYFARVRPRRNCQNQRPRCSRGRKAVAGSPRTPRAISTHLLAARSCPELSGRASVPAQPDDSAWSGAARAPAFLGHRETAKGSWRSREVRMA